MNNYVNLQPLQAILEDCLFSVRYISLDHHDTPITAEDYSNLDLKLIELLNAAKSLLNLESDVKDYLPNLYEANHIKQTRDKIFIKAANAYLKFCKQNGKDFNEDMLNACVDIANDSIEKLYKVKL